MRTSLTCLALLAASTAQADEHIVTLMSGDQPIVGTMTLPDGAPAPVVLLLHGFSGARDELQTEHVSAGVFAYTAAQLEAAGYASLRIDFRGSGESLNDLTFADTTFDGQTADAMAAVAYLKTAPEVAGDTIHVLGWSQGGLVAAALAGQSEGLASVSLWNAVGDPKATFTTLFGAEGVQKGMDAGGDEVVTLALPWGAEIDLKGAFFDGVAGQDPVGDIANYSGPLFVAVGENDTTVLPENGARFIAAHPGQSTLWSAEMDHVFNVFATAETLDTLVSETIAFLDGQAN